MKQINDIAEKIEALPTGKTLWQLVTGGIWLTSDEVKALAAEVKRLTAYVTELENTAPVRRETIKRLIHYRNENKRLTDENALLKEYVQELADHGFENARKILAELGGE